MQSVIDSPTTLTGKSYTQYSSQLFHYLHGLDGRPVTYRQVWIHRPVLYILYCKYPGGAGIVQMRQGSSAG
jgi:hypothetical protein